MPAQHRGTAARPGTAAFHLLFRGVEQDAAAIHMVLHQQALGRQQLPQQAAAHLPQVPGVDAVEFLRLGVGVGKIMQQGGRGCRGHGRAHVVDVPDLIILHTAEGGRRYRHSRPGRLQQAAACRRYGPLGGGGAYSAVAQRGAELPLGGTEMAGRHGQQVLRRPGGAQRSPQTQCFRHGTAGPEHPGKGYTQLPHGITGGRTLGLQVPCQHQPDLFFGQLRLLQAEPGRPQLQVFFRCLPAALAEPVVTAQLIKGCSQRAFPLLFAAHRRLRSDHGRRAEQQCVAASLCHEQNFSFPAKNPPGCAIL